MSTTSGDEGWFVTAEWNLVTGATGLLGSHLVERLVERGERVRALVRPASDVRELERLPVELECLQQQEA
mgnify:FL=1|jgi:uncharacterized protein YbjT (DUF2867 family)